MSRMYQITVKLTGHFRTVIPQFRIQFHVTLLTPRIWRCHLAFWKICGPPALYRVFNNVLHDHKHLYQENQRTHLNGIFHSHGKTEKVFF